MDLNTAIKGMLDAEAKLGSRATMLSPIEISENMYRLGQYTAEVEKHLGDIEEDYEILYATEYKKALETEKSVTAAKLKADLETAEGKGQIKKLSRYVSSAWKVHNGAMARWKHLNAEVKGTT